MSNEQLFSVVILCYRNFEYIYEAIDSVIEQDYPRVQLIVSDDGSANFPKESIEQYILQNRRSNIISFIVNHNAQNLGTVKHINSTIQFAEGDFICFMAGDDTCYNSRAFSNYVDTFNAKSEEYLIQFAHTALFNRTMTKMRGIYMQPEIQRLLENENYEELREWIMNSACLPSTSTCFRKVFFEQGNRFDEQYFLVEDVPMHLRIMTEKIPVCYGNFIATKHRDGGISHGAKGALSKTKIRYYNDISNIFDSMGETLESLSDAQKEEWGDYIREESRKINSLVHRKSPDAMVRWTYYLSHPLLCICKLFELTEGFWKKGKEIFFLSWIGILVLGVLKPLITVLGAELSYFAPLRWCTDLQRILITACSVFLVLGAVMYLLYLFFIKLCSKKEVPVSRLFGDPLAYLNIWK